MGLDIEAYGNVAYVDPQPPEDDDTAYDAGLHRCWVNPDFSDRAEDRQTGWYSAENRYRFRAGSYGGYNLWREWLSETMLGVEPVEVWNAPERWAGRPFVELIHFADNEGIIGPRIAAKLAEDFRTHDAKARAAGGQVADYYYEKYKSFREAFEMAAEDGLVQFC